MPNADATFIPLPSDPKLLTRELALQCCSHPEVLIREFARLANEPKVRQPHQPITGEALVPEGAINGRR